MTTEAQKRALEILSRVPDAGPPPPRDEGEGPPCTYILGVGPTPDAPGHIGVCGRPSVAIWVRADNHESYPVCADHADEEILKPGYWKESP